MLSLLESVYFSRVFFLIEKSVVDSVFNENAWPPFLVFWTIYSMAVFSPEGEGLLSVLSDYTVAVCPVLVRPAALNPSM